MTHNFIPPPPNPLVLKTASQFIKDVNNFQRLLGSSINEKGHKAVIYVDLLGGQTLRLSSLTTPGGAENPSTVIIAGHDSEKRETHIITTYENIALRVVIEREAQEAQEQPQG